MAKLGASTIMTILLVGLALPAAAFVASAGATVPLNSVQVTIQTSANLPFQYSLTAYNTSGYQVAYFNGGYPEASFGLPEGKYLITASAYYQQSYFCGDCPVGVAGKNATTSMPIVYVPPRSEYGYAVVDLTGPTQITIATQNSTQASLVKVPVHVQFVNGTSAVGTYVSAYVVGNNYMTDQRWVTYGQTGSDGNFTLLLPDAPVQVTAYMSIPIKLPQNISTVTVEIGGQDVNVTVYWQPNYVYLSGQTLILPPQTSADITLKVQQSNPYPIYNSGGVAPSAGGTTVTTTVTATATGAKQGSAAPAAVNIAPFNPTGSQLSSSSHGTSAEIGRAHV